MKHECGLCLRDNSICKCGKSFFELLFGQIDDCMFYVDYHDGLQKKDIKILKKAVNK
jgi:hypothetical protein